MISWSGVFLRAILTLLVIPMNSFEQTDGSRTGTEKSFPALSEHLVFRFVAFTALYAAQGLPYGLLSVAVPAYMAAQGVSPAAIGSFIGITILPWSLKLINGPIMDRWSFLPMGRRRPWVLAAQAGMVASSVAIGFLPDPLGHIGWLTALGFALNFFTAFQDVAVDGMAIDIIPINQQARANGFMWGGKVVGTAGATVGGAWMINSWGLDAAWFGHALLIGMVMLIPLLLRERSGERLLPWTSGQAAEVARRLQLEGWRDIGTSLLRVFLLPVSLAGAIAIFAHNIGRGLSGALLPVLAVQELGWTDTGYSGVYATAGLVAGLIGMVAGGMLAERLGRRRVIALGSMLIATASVAMGLFPAFWPLRLSVQVYVSAFLLLDTLITIAFFALLMAVCWKRVAATQFSLYMAIANMGLSGGAALLGPLQGWLGYSPLFFVVACSSLLVIVLVRFVNVGQHLQRVSELDAVPTVGNHEWQTGRLN